MSAPRLRGPSPESDHAVRVVCEVARSVGGRALAVGGCVRDALLGRDTRDVDLEVFGVDPDALGGALRARLPGGWVGRAFPVWKVHGVPVDVSVPREGKAWDPGATPETAALRRDFTINAIALDPIDGSLVDPLGGERDLRARQLRHGSPRFGEDPLRVLRAMQLVARFELEVAEQTVALCRTLLPKAAGLPKERVFGEWSKLVVDGVRPSLGLAFLRASGWLETSPELEALIDCPQDPRWHPEGDVWIHTLHALDVFAEERVDDPREDLVVGLAVLCHDLGKPETTEVEDGRIRSKRHDQAGVACTEALLGRWTAERRLIDEVNALVAAHLAPVQLFQDQASDRAIRRLSKRVGRIDRLVRVARADQFGRPPLPRDRFEAGEWLLARAHALDVVASAPPPLVTGRMLLQLGARPGPPLGAMLERCYDAQLDGRFDDEAGALRFAERTLWDAERSEGE